MSRSRTAADEDELATERPVSRMHRVGALAVDNVIIGRVTAGGFRQ